jgi:hypothetical protein
MRARRNNMIYSIFREGIYRHECLGIFTDLDIAICVAMNEAVMEPDNYHSIEVRPFELNMPTPKSIKTALPSSYVECDAPLSYRRDTVLAMEQLVCFPHVFNSLKESQDANI